MAAQVADRFDLGPDARLEVEAARGEQGQVRRLVTARGVFALKETFGELDVDESELTAAFQARCHDAGVPCPRPLADGDGRYVAHVDGQPAAPADVGRRRRRGPDAGPRVRRHGGRPAARVVVPATETPHEWHTEPVGAAEWRALVKAARGAGAPYADRLAALVPDLLAMEELLTPMAGRQWCHLDLWADNLRGTPEGGVCVIDFDNAGPAEPTRELAMVLFEFTRSGRDRLHALVAAYEEAGGSGRVARAEDFGVTIAQLHHIGRHQVLGWLRARDPEARARAHAGVEEFVGDPFRVADVERLLGWLRG